MNIQINESMMLDYFAVHASEADIADFTPNTVGDIPAWEKEHGLKWSRAAARYLFARTMLAERAKQEGAGVSADNWTICPACMTVADKKHSTAKTRAEQAYGKVPAHEWMKLTELAKQEPEIHQTLREDYEIGICTDGEFYVKYSASCECGFSFSYEYEDKAWKPAIK